VHYAIHSLKHKKDIALCNIIVSDGFSAHDNFLTYSYTSQLFTDWYIENTTSDTLHFSETPVARSRHVALTMDQSHTTSLELLVEVISYTTKCNSGDSEKDSKNLGRGIGSMRKGGGDTGLA